MKKALLIFARLQSILLVACTKDAASVGIIGGADGPTAIYVASNGYASTIVSSVVALAVIAGVILVIKKKNK